ncbi:MAG: hypothetical protein GY940_22095 [bacterium]|nr:hypothetical protein [bacterium]
MKKNRISILFIFVMVATVTMITMFTAGCSSKGGSGNYYQEMSDLVGEVMTKASQLNSSMIGATPEKVKGQLRNLQAFIKTNADKANEMGGFKGDEKLYNSVLDLLEFYETLYNDDFPPIIDSWSARDRDGADSQILNFNARLNTELPELEEEFFSSENEFVAKHSLSKTSRRVRSGTALRARLTFKGNTSQQPQYMDETGMRRSGNQAKTARDRVLDIEAKRKKQ